MEQITVLICFVIVFGLAFDFVNGFHDASNSIATVVATRMLTPRRAVLWAAFFNVIAVFIFGTGVAHTMGAGLIALDSVTPLVVLCALFGATLWGLSTWWLRLPTSSSHALLGGYAGAAMANSALRHGWEAASHPIIVSGWIKVIAFIVIAPVMGLLLSHILMKLLGKMEKRFSYSPDTIAYKRLQLMSSAFLSLMHGSNDAQKTAGILTSALVSGGVLHSFAIPMWILGVSYGVIGCGTLAGGWRIVRTMGSRLTKLNPRGGVCAESAAALSILTATLCNLPVSTTHVTTGAILGVGVANDAATVRWTIARRIALAWILTIPAASFIGGGAMLAASLLTRG